MKEKIKSNKPNVITIVVIVVIALVGCIYGGVHQHNYLNDHDLNGRYICEVTSRGQTEKWSIKFKNNKTFVYTAKFMNKYEDYWDSNVSKETGTYQLSKGNLKLKGKQINAEGKLSEDKKSFTLKKVKNAHSSTQFPRFLRTGLTFKIDE